MEPDQNEAISTTAQVVTEPNLIPNESAIAALNLSLIGGGISEIGSYVDYGPQLDAGEYDFCQLFPALPRRMVEAAAPGGQVPPSWCSEWGWEEGNWVQLRGCGNLFECMYLCM